ncbi:unnamed protein product [Protopolystoma xenopodis]|uniref:Uncharacterized protein n=1 Tax=Protopolystoma xenopodis TaxID=117903 RepID=A0A448WG54_9PLAT|nr:unnamed protein product [Protopolystoma xenopodis]
MCNNLHTRTPQSAHCGEEAECGQPPPLGPLPSSPECHWTSSLPYEEAGLEVVRWTCTSHNEGIDICQVFCNMRKDHRRSTQQSIGSRSSLSVQVWAKSERMHPDLRLSRCPRLPALCAHAYMLVSLVGCKDFTANPTFRSLLSIARQRQASLDRGDGQQVATSKCNIVVVTLIRRENGRRRKTDEPISPEKGGESQMLRTSMRPQRCPGWQGPLDIPVFLLNH